MIEVILCGIQSSFQDLGRFGYRRFGIPISGAMDQIASKRANRLVGNMDDTVLIEFLLQGPILKFHESIDIAICGAAFTPSIDGVEIQLNEKIRVSSGATLKIGTCKSGNYGYLAISGGFKTPKKYKSASYYTQILPENKIQKGDSLFFTPIEKNNSSALEPLQPNTDLLVYPGPEFDCLTAEQQELIFKSELKISSDISRMGYKLVGIESFYAPEIITAPVQPGTVQLTPSGHIIILMRDAQTTGGYSRILQLEETSISNLAQKRIGDSVYFSITKK